MAFGEAARLNQRPSFSAIVARRGGRPRTWTVLAAGAVLVAALLCAARRPARAQEVAQRPTFHVSVDRIQIGAVITDSKGRHVTDLGIGDFAVLDGGKRQQLTRCEYIRLADSGLTPPTVPQERALRAPPPSAAHELTREQVRRTIVLLVDDISLAAATIPAVREAVRSTIERSLQAGDLVALIRTSSGNGSLEQFTLDKRVLLESAARIRWRPESRGTPGMLPQTSGAVVGEHGGSHTNYLVGDSERRTTAVLRYVISALRDVPGRKAIFTHLLSRETGCGTARSSFWRAPPCPPLAPSRRFWLEADSLARVAESECCVLPEAAGGEHSPHGGGYFPALEVRMGEILNRSQS